MLVIVPGPEANVTLILEASASTAVVEAPIQLPDVDAPTSWARAAARAHALLSQTMPDEEIDELVHAAVPFAQPIVLPAFLFG